MLWRCVWNILSPLHGALHVSCKVLIWLFLHQVHVLKLMLPYLPAVSRNHWGRVLTYQQSSLASTSSPACKYLFNQNDIKCCGNHVGDMGAISIPTHSLLNGQTSGQFWNVYHNLFYQKTSNTTKYLQYFKVLQIH